MVAFALGTNALTKDQLAQELNVYFEAMAKEFQKNRESYLIQLLRYSAKALRMLRRAGVVPAMSTAVPGN